MSMFRITLHSLRCWPGGMGDPANPATPARGVVTAHGPPNVGGQEVRKTTAVPAGVVLVLRTVQPVDQLLSRAALHGQSRTDRTLTRPCPTAHGVAAGEV